MNQSNPCYVTAENKFNSDFLKKATTEYFTIVAKIGSNIYARLAQAVIRKDSYIEENFEIYQSVRSFITRKGIKSEKRKHLEKSLGVMIEKGFSSTFLNRFRDFGIKLEKMGGQDGFQQYSGLQNYIAENTKVTALQFDKLDYLFRIYFAFVIVILLLNLAHYCATVIGHQIEIWFFRVISFS